MRELRRSSVRRADPVNSLPATRRMGVTRLERSRLVEALLKPFECLLLVHRQVPRHVLRLRDVPRCVPEHLDAIPLWIVEIDR